MERCTPHPLPLTICSRPAGRGAMRVGKLTLSLTSCNTWESRPWTSPGQHNRADPVDRAWVSQPWEHESRRSGPDPFDCHVVVWARKGCPPSPPRAGERAALGAGAWKQKSWPCPPSPHQLQHSGVGPASHLSSTVELVLAVWVVGELPMTMWEQAN